ncbi:MAG: isochorismatase family protein [Bryobacterales bacterium]|nr:isochorismatase family protein [Bryobacterales bacterium]
MTKSTLARATDSVLVVVDTQDRLAAVMDAASIAGVIANIRLLLQGAKLLGIPVLLVEQYPQGLGFTVPPLLEMLPASVRRVEKTCFSCAGADGFLQALDDAGRSQVILAGMEAHVCVLQSAMELLTLRPEVFVVEDACCSRDGNNHRNAMTRMSHAGIIVASAESILFEWLRDSHQEHFRAISALLR